MCRPSGSQQIVEGCNKSRGKVKNSSERILCTRLVCSSNNKNAGLLWKHKENLKKKDYKKNLKKRKKFNTKLNMKIVSRMQNAHTYALEQRNLEKHLHNISLYP